MFILILRINIQKQTMNYFETVEFLYSQLPMYQRRGKTAFKKTSDNIIALCDKLGNPHLKFKSIHIAGTNGKGSVSHIFASILQEAGYKTGLYTSPHLKDFRERIRINGTEIPENEVTDFVEKNMSLFGEIKPSFFEMTVALAFYYFAKEKVDVAVIETGLGGRLDSTNVISPVLSVITNIDFDHKQFLGNTLKDIAYEKAGIIKENTPVVIGEYSDETADVFIKTAKEKKSDIYFADKEYSCDYSMLTSDYKQVLNVYKNGKLYFENLKTDLLGIYQRKNIVTVLKSIEILSDKFKISRDNIYSGTLNVKSNTGFRGRWDILGFNPLIIADTGHNEAGIKEILKQLKNTAYKKLHFVLGTVDDKDIENILKLLPKDAVYYFTKAQIPRALNEKELKNKAEKFGLEGKTFGKTEEAFLLAKKNAGKNDLIFVGGSTFTVAEIL